MRRLIWRSTLPGGAAALAAVCPLLPEPWVTSPGRAVREVSWRD